jgi:FkbM family methyltransferase
MLKTPHDIDFVCHDRRVRFRIDRPDDHIQREIAARRNFYESAMLDSVACRLRPGGTVIDVGANVGNHTVYFAALLGQDVISIEPNPAALATLRTNVALNRLESRVRILPVAAGAGPSRGSVRDDDPNNLGRASLQVEPEGDVEVRSIDDIAHGLRIDLIKVDVEGMEPAVLEGARGTIARCRPVLLVEAADLAALRAVEAVVRPLGYRKLQVFNATPTWLFEHASAGPGRSVLERVRPEVLSRLPATRAVVAGMATVGGNEQALRGAVTSLLPQVDRLYVWLNRADAVPAFLIGHPKIVTMLDPDGTRYGDAGKFWGLQQERDVVYVACDDDILYPPDFVVRMLEHLSDLDGRAVVGVHGALLLQPSHGYYADGSRSVFHFSQPLVHRHRVHVVGTGTCVFHDAVIRLGMAQFEHPNMADIWLARHLQAIDCPAYVVPRPAGWLQSLEVSRPTIYEASRSDSGTAFNSSLQQDAVLGTMWPVSVLDAPSPPAVAHLVRTDDAGCLAEALDALRGASLDVDARAFVVLCDEATEAMRAAALRPGFREEVHLLARGAPLTGAYLRLLRRPGLCVHAWTIAGEQLAPADAASLLGALSDARCPAAGADALAVAQ